MNPIEVNPIEVIWCWQALLVALTAAGMTQFIKAATDAAHGKAVPTPTPTLKDMVAVGKARREENVVLNRVIMPSVPVFIGALIAVIVPMRSDIVAAYALKTAESWDDYLIFAIWGGTCGMFADYAVTKAKSLLDDLIKRTKPPSTPPPPPADPGEGA